MDMQHLGEAIVGGLVLVKQGVDFFGGRARDRRHSDGQAKLRAEIAQQFAEFNLKLAELRAFVVGPDGQNGLRGDLGEVKERVDELEERERNRLQPRQVGSLQPR